MADIREGIVTKLVSTRRFGSTEAARLAERAGWCCEYCHLDMLASVENYKLWHNDHIIPKGKGGLEEFDNLALSCLHCNWHFKRDFDPRTELLDSPNPTRDQLIAKAAAYIKRQRDKAAREVEFFRTIIGPAKCGSGWQA